MSIVLKETHQEVKGNAESKSGKESLKYIHRKPLKYHPRVDILYFQGLAYRENTMPERIIAAQTTHHSCTLRNLPQCTPDCQNSLRKKRLTQHQVNNL